MACFRYYAPDTASATPEQIATQAQQTNHVLRDFGAGWMFQWDVIRADAPGYPEGGSFPDHLTALIDTERRQFYGQEGSHYDTEYFLTVTWAPPPELEGKAVGILVFEGDGKQIKKSSADKLLEYFRSRVETLGNFLGSLFPVQPIGVYEVQDDFGVRHSYSDQLRFLRQCVSGESFPFRVPEIPFYLDQQIGCQDFVGGLQPKVGSYHLGVVAIDGFPRAAYPGVLNGLNALPMAYRWSTRWIFLDPEDAKRVIGKERKKWGFQVVGWWARILGSTGGAINHHAAEMVADAEQAMSEAESREVQFGLCNTKVICWEKDPDVLHLNLALVEKTVKALGFGCRREDINAVEGWLGSQPGNGYQDIRRTILHTRNVADLAPSTSVFTGLQENPSPLMPPHSPPLCYAETTGATPFRVHLHVNDVGNLAAVGPTGSGKTTVEGLFAAQFRRFPNAQVFIFDKGGGFDVLTHACGGDLYQVGVPGSLAMCPMSGLGTVQDISWAVGYLEQLVALQSKEGESVGPAERADLLNAVNAVSRSPTPSLTEVLAKLQNKNLRAALKAYTIGGLYGYLLDADHDNLGNNPFLTFDLHHLLSDKGIASEQVIVPVLLYIFRQIEKRLDGRPTLIIMEEAWVHLRHPLVCNRMEEWLRTLRKRNASVLFATQSLSDIIDSPLRTILLESCPTKIFLPNREADHKASREAYESLGLNPREIEIIRDARYQQDYYYVSPLGRRLVSFGLGPVTLSFVGVGSNEDRQAVETLRAANPATWQADWLRIRGLADWAAYYEELLKEKPSA